MHASAAKPDFLTFSELAARWAYSAEYVHDLIRTGKIIPAVALTDQERYVGGRFSGGYVVGDVDNARHQSYAEYYVGTVPGRDDHYENRPQCGRIVFCHSPVDDLDGGYSFQFISESADPGETKQWFYLDHGEQIGSADERRFRFDCREVDRFESENSEDGSQLEDKAVTGRVGMPERAQSTPPVEQKPVRHKLESRVPPLRAEIDLARRKALDPEDANSVWAELLKLAESNVGCLVGLGEREVKYRAVDGEVEYFTKRNLRDRMRRARER